MKAVLVTIVLTAAFFGMAPMANAATPAPTTAHWTVADPAPQDPGLPGGVASVVENVLDGLSGALAG
jgi:hypothetical protein